MFGSFIEKITAIPVGIKESVGALVKSPMSILMVVLIIVCGINLIRLSKIKFTTKLITHISISVTMALILNMFVVYKMPQGGSVTLVSMLPIFFISFVYGANAGVLTGLIFGILNLILGGYVVHPIQVLLDYPVPFMLLGIAGVFPKHINLGMIIATSLRLLAHVISGFVFFAEYAPKGQNPLVYSFIYNITYLLPDLILVIIVMNILPINNIAKRILNKDLELKYW